MNKVLFSHESDHWSTPDYIYWWFCGQCKYYDPCPLHADFDGLETDWSVHKGIFINPPYSNIMPFVKKAIEVHKVFSTHHITFLLPVRTDTKWFKALSEYGCDIEFIDHRLKFGNSKNCAPFPSMLVTLETVHGCHDDRHVNRFETSSLNCLAEWYKRAHGLTLF